MKKLSLGQDTLKKLTLKTLYIKYGLLLCVDIQMTLTLVLLPLLLSEAPFAVNSGERRRKRSVWKPSAVETMENFVDLQEVSVEFIFLDGCVLFNL